MHSHLDCNYPFNFFYVTVLFVMNILPGYYRNWPRVGLLVSPDLTGRASPWCWFPVAGFRLTFFAMSEIFFEIFFRAAATYLHIYSGASTLRCTRISLREAEANLFLWTISYKLKKNISEMVDRWKNQRNWFYSGDKSSEQSPQMTHTKLRLKTPA